MLRLISKFKYNVNKFRNSIYFISKYEQIQKMAQAQHSFKATYVPAAILGGSLISFILWQQLPYSTLFPHLTISEYVPKQYYFHSALLAPLNFQTTGHLLVYGPLLLYSFFLASQTLTNGQFLLLYALNSVITTAVTVYYERKKNMQFSINLMSPKCLGAVTPLAYICAISIIKPEFRVFRTPPLPLFIIPIVYAMYEIQEYQNGFVNELCRPAHLSALINGVVAGIILRRFI